MPTRPIPRGMIEIFLQPGELYFGDRTTRIRTLLGSCVSLVLWHPQQCIGGMCHYMLPSRQRPPGAALDGRYGDEALELLLRDIQASGNRPEDFRLRVFGGGNMFPALARSRRPHVGRQNVEAAKRMIQQHGLTCHAAHVGGIGHRNLIFDIWSGQVALKQPAPIASPS